MKFIGLITVALLATGVGLALVVGMRSAPDIQRYLRMRQM